MKLFFIGLFIMYQAIGQTNNETTINGIIKSSNGEPLIGATIFIPKLSEGTTTDIDGNFELKLPNGCHSILINYLGFKESKDSLCTNVTNVTFVLTEDSKTIEEILVVANVNKESSIIHILHQKESIQINQAIGASELKINGVSDAGSGAKKIVGLSIVGGKYLYVRGLNDRYNNATLNGLPIPSFDPDKKVIPLNIFTTDIIENINVIKTFAPNMQGDFTGGTFNINTKSGGGDKKTWIITNINSSNFNSQKSYKNHSSLFKNPQFNINSSLSTVDKKYTPNYGFQIGTSGEYSINKTSKLFYILKGSLGTSSNQTNGNIKLINAQSNIRLNYKLQEFSNSTLSNILTSVNYSRKNSNIGLTYLFVRSTNNSIRESDGNHFDYESKIFTKRFITTINSLNTIQLIGNYKNLKYAITTSTVNSKEPDRRQLVFLYDDTPEGNIYRFNIIDKIDNHHLFSKLNEKEISSKIEYNKTIKIFKLTSGIDGRLTNRNFDYQRYIYNLTNAIVNPNNPDLFLGNPNLVNDPASKYTGNEKIVATYLITQLKYNDLNLSGGLRAELFHKTISYKDQMQPIYTKTNGVYGVNLLPSIICKINKNNFVLRSSFTKTTTRPAFKEMALFEYRDYFGGARTIGNPNLKTGYNYNIDGGIEFYSNKTNLIGLNLFYKKLINPIEMVAIASSSGQLMSFQNALGGNVAGIEFESKLKFKNFNFSGNATLLYTKVNSNTNGYLSLIATNPIHKMQGASPYLFNCDISYNFQKNNYKFITGVSTNLFGPRLFALGIQGIPDFYEMSALNVNLMFSFIIQKYIITFNCLNITNTKSRISQYNSEKWINVLNIKGNPIFNLSVKMEF